MAFTISTALGGTSVFLGLVGTVSRCGPDGPTGVGKTVEVYAKAFPDMHRELYRFFSVGDVVAVELALQGTHKGPLPTPMGILPPTGMRMDAPCCDVFRLVNGKIQSFDCYPSGTVIFAQLGVLSNIEAAIALSQEASSGDSPSGG